MHTAPATQLRLKVDVLDALIGVLRESHRCRSVFRKVGGFVYVMSLLVSLEKCLNHPPVPPWDDVTREDIILLLRTLFGTLTVAMKFEPANARFFQVRRDQKGRGRSCEASNLSHASAG